MIKAKTITFFASVLLALLLSCSPGKKKRFFAGFQYALFKDSVQTINRQTPADTANIFDKTVFVPGKDSLDTLLAKLDSLWTYELSQQGKSDPLPTGKEQLPALEDNERIAVNKQSLFAFLNSKTTNDTLDCRERSCPVYVEVIKSKQLLYLYIENELIDSFAVSTGNKSRETPNFSVKPSGPIFTKYTSTKFPGGNFRGLGNMPYAVFIKGGYAIHGTTPGNFARLGSPASHGCIRLHPDNARIFYELVKEVGLENTWVTVKEM